MLRHSPSRSYRSKKLRPRHSFQALLLFAVGIWIVYQLTRSYGKRRGAVVVVETDVDGNAMDGGEPAARRRMGRKAFIGFAGHASDDADIVGAGVGGQGAGWDAASSDDQLSKSDDREGDGDGDEEDQEQEADEDDGADDDVAGDEEDDDTDLLLSPSDEMENILGESDRATLFGNGSAGPPANATARVQDAAASEQTNATDSAAEGMSSVKPLTDSPPLKNSSTVTAGVADTAEKLVANGSAIGAENAKHTVPVDDN